MKEITCTTRDKQVNIITDGELVMVLFTEEITIARTADLFPPEEPGEEEPPGFTAIVGPRTLGPAIWVRPGPTTRVEVPYGAKAKVRHIHGNVDDDVPGDAIRARITDGSREVKITIGATPHGTGVIFDPAVPPAGVEYTVKDGGVRIKFRREAGAPEEATITPLDEGVEVTAFGVVTVEVDP